MTGGGGGTTTTVYPQKPVYPAGHGAAGDFYRNFLPRLLGQPLPSYQGSIDPGMSPTMFNAMQMAQNQAMSPTPSIMGQANGTLGAFMQGPQNWSYQQGASAPSLNRFMYPSYMDPSSATGPSADYFNPAPRPRAQSFPFDMPGGGYGGAQFNPYPTQGGGSSPDARYQATPAAGKPAPAGAWGGLPDRATGQRRPDPMAEYVQRMYSAFGPGAGGSGSPQQSGPDGLVGQQIGQYDTPGAPVGGGQGTTPPPGPSNPSTRDPGDRNRLPPLPPDFGTPSPWNPVPPGWGLGGPTGQPPVGDITWNRPGGRGDGGGGGYGRLFREGLPVYQPTQHTPSFVPWSPGGRQDRPMGGTPDGLVESRQGDFYPNWNGMGGTGRPPRVAQNMASSYFPPGGVGSAPGVERVSRDQSNSPAGPFNGPTSAMDVYRSAVPVMQQQMKDNIDQAMAQTGLTGNRFSSSAQTRAAEVGAETGLQQQQLLSDLLYRQTNTDLDRALQATGMQQQADMQRNALGMQYALGGGDQALRAAQLGYDQGRGNYDMQWNNINQLAQLGQWEQGRQDQFSLMPYQEFLNSRQGWIPQAMGAFSSVGSPIPQQPITTQSGGGPSSLDYALQAASIAAMFAASDERAKDDVRTMEPAKALEMVREVGGRTWRWKGGPSDSGVVAQDVERHAPSLVRERGDGLKMVNYTGLVGNVVSAMTALDDRLKAVESRKAA